MGVFIIRIRGMVLVECDFSICNSILHSFPQLFSVEGHCVRTYDLPLCWAGVVDP